MNLRAYQGQTRDGRKTPAGRLSGRDPALLRRALRQDFRAEVMRMINRVKLAPKRWRTMIRMGVLLSLMSCGQRESAGLAPLTWPNGDRPEFHPEEMERFRGLARLAIHVDFVSQAAQDLGIDRRTLSNWSYARLRLRGIPVLDTQVAADTPTLTVHTDILTSRDNTKFYSLGVSCREDIVLKRVPTLAAMQGKWWESSRSGVFAANSEIEDQLGEILDEFARLYLAANASAPVKAIDLPELPPGRQSELDKQARDYGSRFLRVGDLKLARIGDYSQGGIYSVSMPVTNTGTDTCSRIRLVYSAPETWWRYTDGASMQSPDVLDVNGDYRIDEKSDDGLKPLQSAELGEVLVVPRGSVDASAFRLLEAFCFR